LADVAVLANRAAGHYVREMPYFGAIANGTTFVDDGRRVGKEILFHRRGWFSLWVFV
jgi:hypothetical protein